MWGSNYNRHVVLWPGSISSNNLDETREIFSQSSSNHICSTIDYDKSSDFCKKMYELCLNHITSLLNNYNKRNYTTDFYGTLFGYWLYRHICVVYDKFRILNLIDWQNVDLKILHETSFYTPFNHYDWFRCFTTDFGIEQLISNFCQASKIKHLENLKLSFNYNDQEQNLIKTNDKSLQQFCDKSEKLICKAKIELIGLYFSKTNLKKLTESLGDQLLNHNILDISITKKLDIDYTSRNEFSKVFTGNDFLIFLGETLKFGIPKCFLEYFKIYECQIKALVKKSNAEYVISENWISNVPSSMYVALSKENGKKFICHEHAGPGGIYKPNIVWHEEKYSDVFITCGWTNGSTKLVKGGFSSRDLQPRTDFLQTGSILFIDFTRPPYLIQYTGSHLSNFERIKQLESTESFLIQAKATLGNRLLYRDRQAADFWNTTDPLSHVLDGVNIDEGDLSESIKSARLVILNHLSSSAAEVLLNDIPFILFVDSEIDVFDERFDGLISKLKESLILHDTPESAIKHANQSNNKLQKWWESKSVRQILALYKKNLVGPPEQSIQYIVNLQNKISF